MTPDASQPYHPPTRTYLGTIHRDDPALDQRKKRSLGALHRQVNFAALPPYLTIPGAAWLPPTYLPTYLPPSDPKL